MSATQTPEEAPSKEGLPAAPGSRVAACRAWCRENYLVLLAIAAMIAGTIQNPLLISVSDVQVERWNTSGEVLWTVSEAPFVKYIDDVLVLVLVLASLLRFKRMYLWPKIGVIIWGVLLMVSLAVTVLVTKPVSTDNAIFLFRQVALPAALILPGLAFTKHEWRLAMRWTIGIALANAAYALLEFFHIRVFDPATLAVLDGRWVDEESGLPGNFRGWWIDGSYVDRLGGIVVNPPTLGIVCAVAAVMAWWTLRNLWWRLAVVAALSLTALGSISRGGWVILIAGILFPYLVKFFGKWLSLAFAALIAAVFGYLLMGHGKSFLHLEGLLGGIQDAFMSIIGRGFGFAGNFAEAAESKESLLGIAFSAGGVLAVMLVVVFTLALLKRVLEDRAAWLASLALGGVAVAALAETAGSIYGTIPLWLAAGYALKRAPELDRNGVSEWLAARGMWGKKTKEKNVG